MQATKVCTSHEMPFQEWVNICFKERVEQIGYITRNMLDDKGLSNTDAKYTVHVDGKDATFRETSNTKTARILSIDFNKDSMTINTILNEGFVHPILL